MRRAYLAIFFSMVLFWGAIAAASFDVLDDSPFSKSRVRYLIASAGRVSMGIETSHHTVYYKGEIILNTDDYLQEAQGGSSQKMYDSKEIWREGSTHITEWKSQKGRLRRTLKFLPWQSDDIPIITYSLYANVDGVEKEGGEVRSTVIKDSAVTDFASKSESSDRIFASLPISDVNGSLSEDFDFRLSYIFDDYLYLRDNSTVIGWDGYKSSSQWNILPETMDIWGIHYLPAANKSSYRVLNSIGEDMVILEWNGSLDKPSLSLDSLLYPAVVTNNKSFQLKFAVRNTGKINMSKVSLEVRLVPDGKILWSSNESLPAGRNLTLSANLAGIEESGGEAKFLLAASGSGAAAQEAFSVLYLPTVKSEFFAGPFLVFWGVAGLAVAILGTLALVLTLAPAKKSGSSKCQTCGYGGDGGKCPVCGSQY